MVALNAEQVLHLLMEGSIDELDSGEEQISKKTLPFLSHGLTSQMKPIVLMKTVSFVIQIS